MKKFIAIVLVNIIWLGFGRPVLAANSGCPQYRGVAIQAGWTASRWPRVSQYMYRESKCKPNVRSVTHDSGLMQINDIVTKDSKIRSMVGTTLTIQKLMNPLFNLRVAKALCDYGIRYHRRGGCYWAWQ